MPALEGLVEWRGTLVCSWAMPPESFPALARRSTAAICCGRLVQESIHPPFLPSQAATQRLSDRFSSSIAEVAPRTGRIRGDEAIESHKPNGECTRHQQLAAVSRSRKGVLSNLPDLEPRLELRY